MGEGFEKMGQGVERAWTQTEDGLRQGVADIFDPGPRYPGAPGYPGDRQPGHFTDGTAHGVPVSGDRATVPVIGVPLGPASSTATAIAPCILRQGTPIIVRGLHSAQQHNGKEGHIMRYELATGRYTVQLEAPDTAQLAMKHEHCLQKVAAEVINLQAFVCCSSIAAPGWLGGLPPATHCAESGICPHVCGHPLYRRCIMFPGRRSVHMG
jgi:hypothetical protein